jgi:hypothetical protein
MVNAIGSLVLRPDPLRHALYRAYEKLPRAIAIPLEMWSNDLTYGRLIDAVEKAGDREELRHLYGEAGMYRSMLEDERLERESLRLDAIARKHLVAIPHYDGHEDNKSWEQSHRNGNAHLTLLGIAEARKAIDEDFKRRWGRRMFWIQFFGTIGLLNLLASGLRMLLG